MGVVDLLVNIQHVLIASGRASLVETHADDPSLASNVLRVDGRVLLIAEPVRYPAQFTVNNEITLMPRDPSQPRLVVSRMAIGAGKRGGGRRGVQRKTVTVMMTHGTSIDEDLCGLALFDEDYVIDGLLHLFPDGELVPRAESSSDNPWPYRKVQWETSDGQVWASSEVANAHQAELDRETTHGSEGAFYPWYFIKSPENDCSIGEARVPEDLLAIQKGLAMVPGYSICAGFETEQEAIRAGAAAEEACTSKEGS